MWTDEPAEVDLLAPSCVRIQGYDDGRERLVVAELLDTSSQCRDTGGSYMIDNLHDDLQ